MSDNSIKIANPERIKRILNKICDASLQVILRPEGGGKLGVRGKAEKLSSKSIMMSGISEQGIAYLEGKKKVKVEFRGMSTQVSFDGEVLTLGGGYIDVSLPKVLVSLERRKNARYATTVGLPAYVTLKSWSAKIQDLGAPPILPHMPELSSWIRLADVSASGFCLATRFPSLSRVLARGAQEEEAKLILPMQTPVVISFSVRWSKKLRETKDHDVHHQIERHFRLGAELTNPSPEAIKSLRTFVQQLTLAEAV